MGVSETFPRDEPFVPAGAETVSVNIPTAVDEMAAAPVLQAEWALWGKEEQRTALHVLRCSKGALTGDDFLEIFTRYATGMKEEFPQYSVYWIPADEKQRRPPYLAVGIHEMADPDPARAGGRRRHVAGRIVEYIRLFCFRYADVAEFEASYAGLVSAVRDIQLVPGRSDPLQVPLPLAGDPSAAGGPAERVASLLLTQRPVCVLDADHVPVAQRLAFIDEVMSLLPFGLRATLSASTWASPTAQDLKLRLFFSSARRDSSSRTCHVSWTRPDHSTVPPGTFEAMEFYGEWLREADTPARALLSSIKDPVRFADDDISWTLGQLPRNKTLAETFAELSASLRAGDQGAVSMALKPLKPYVKRPVDPADRKVYRSLVEQHQLLTDHPELHASTRVSLHKTLLKLAYGDTVSYAEYCGIERAAGGQPGKRLQTVLLGGSSLTPLPCILTAKAAPGYPDSEVMSELARQGFGPKRLLSDLDQQIEAILPGHRRVLDDFVLRYLWSHGADPQEELKKRGYLSAFFTRAYPDDARRQQQRLQFTLRLVYGNGEPADDDLLSQRDIVEVFSRTRLRTAGPIEDAVKSLAKPKLRHFIEQEAMYARMTQDGQGAAAAELRHANRHRVTLPRPTVPLPRRPARHPSEGLPATFLMVPTKNIKAVGFAVLGAAAVIAVVYLAVHLAGG